MQLRREYKNVLVLVIAQAIVGAQLPIAVTIMGLIGQNLASNLCWATLPISLMVFGSMTTAPWLGLVMQKFGRRVGFWCGCFGGLTGGAIGLFALSISSFELFLVGAYFTGIYMSTNGFLRFAAADTASPEFRPKAVSYALAGGLFAAILGPQLVNFTYEMGAQQYMGTYFAVMILNSLGFVIFNFLDIPKVEKGKENTFVDKSYLDFLKNPTILVAIICGSVSYALMNLVMTSTPLAVVGMGHSHYSASNIVSAHVLAMFIPSFFTGHLIARYGAERIVSYGLLLLTFSGAVGLMGIELGHFYVALILLGLGWNFGFIGATNLLLTAHKSHERGKVQGLNDFLVFGSVTLASLTSGTLMNCTGGSAQAGWSLVNWAMVPFLILAAGSLGWLYFHKKNRKESVERVF